MNNEQIEPYDLAIAGTMNSLVFGSTKDQMLVLCIGERPVISTTNEIYFQGMIVQKELNDYMYFAYSLKPLRKKSSSNTHIARIQFTKEMSVMMLQIPFNTKLRINGFNTYDDHYQSLTLIECGMFAFTSEPKFLSTVTDAQRMFDSYAGVFMDVKKKPLWYQVY